MVEAGAQQVSEAEVLAAIEFGHDCCKKIAAGDSRTGRSAARPSASYTPPDDQSGALRPDLGRGPRRSDGRDQHAEVREARKLQPHREAKDKAIEA